MGIGLGDILGSISPAFGMASGNGIFGNKDVLGTLSPLYGMATGKGLGGSLGGMGLGGLLGMLLGGGGEGEDQANAQDAASLGNPATTKSPLTGPGSDAGLVRDPMKLMDGADPLSRMRRFGRFGNDFYFGGQMPFGQNAIGKFLGGLF